MVLQKARLFVLWLLCAVVAVLVSNARAAVVDETDNAEAAKKEAAERNRIMQSDEMLKALIWHEEYYRASAEHEEKELQELEARLARMSSIELRRFLLKFRRDRRLARSRQAASEAMRQQSLALRQDHLRWQHASREAALDRSHFGYRPYFGSTPHYFPGYTRYVPGLYYGIR